MTHYYHQFSQQKLVKLRVQGQLKWNRMSYLQGLVQPVQSSQHSTCWLLEYLVCLWDHPIHFLELHWSEKLWILTGLYIIKTFELIVHDKHSTNIILVSGTVNNPWLSSKAPALKYQSHGISASFEIKAWWDFKIRHFFLSFTFAKDKCCSFLIYFALHTDCQQFSCFSKSLTHFFAWCLFIGSLHLIITYNVRIK